LDYLSRLTGNKRASNLAMLSKHVRMLEIGLLAFIGCATLNAQPGSTLKLPKGAYSPHVAQCTNCVRDVNGRISQNPAPVRRFRSMHPCPANGSMQGACPGYVVDFKKALARGGKDAPENMRWRTIAQVMKKKS
jgi:hypothetical protein